MQELIEMKWDRNYPNIIEDDRFCLLKGNWGFRLIYRVYFKKNGEEFLGICHVMERKVKRKQQHNIVVVELNAKSTLLNKRMREIEQLIQNNIV